MVGVVDGIVEGASDGIVEGATDGAAEEALSTSFAAVYSRARLFSSSVEVGMSSASDGRLVEVSGVVGASISRRSAK